MENRTLEEGIAYVFQDAQLLETALTHSSYTAEHGKSYRSNNERLEFIGDAFLDAIVGLKLFRIMPEVQEGVLSKARAKVVCERSLAEVARDLDLGRYLRLGKGEERCGGREKPSILADAVEAIIGAVFLDGGYSEASALVLNLFDEHIRLAVRGKLYTDYKTALQEQLQEEYQNPHIAYRILSESGPDHDKTFVAAVYLQDRLLGRGQGGSKKEAEQSAAAAAIRKGEQ